MEKDEDEREKIFELGQKQEQENQLGRDIESVVNRINEAKLEVVVNADVKEFNTTCSCGKVTEKGILCEECGEKAVDVLIMKNIWIMTHGDNVLERAIKEGHIKKFPITTYVFDEDDKLEEKWKDGKLIEKVKHEKIFVLEVTIFDKEDVKLINAEWLKNQLECSDMIQNIVCIIEIGEVTDKVKV